MLICIEGIDGVGKSTTCEELKVDMTLKHNMQKIHLFHEPGSTDYGNLIYDVFKQGSKHKALPDTQMLLVNACRVELFKKIRNKHKNEIIILDRYILSTLAYQGFSNKRECFTLRDIYLISFACSMHIIPDFTFVIVADPEEVKVRLDNRCLDDSMPIGKIQKLIKDYDNTIWYLKKKQQWKNIHKIDSTNMTSAQVSMNIMSIIYE